VTEIDELALANSFDLQRPKLRAVAYRILGSLSEADDDVQEAWLRLRGADSEQIDCLERELMTVVARICLNMPRFPRTRREQPLERFVPEPIIDDPAAGTDPEHEVLLAESVGIALLVVLETLSPAERLAFVLHDMFAVPFDEIAPMVDRSPQATRQLASRARRRVRDPAPPPDPDGTRQRAVVDAFFAAAREGDFEALVMVLDPDVVLRAHRRDGDPIELHGSARVARGAMTAGRYAPYVRPALVNGAAGVVAFEGERPFAVLAFTVVGDHAVAIDVFNDPELVVKLDISGISASARRRSIRIGHLLRGPPSAARSPRVRGEQGALRGRGDARRLTKAGLAFLSLSSGGHS
jgi:RNA polymerase sigma-70 factor (ECF subfamily)